MLNWHGGLSFTSQCFARIPADICNLSMFVSVIVSWESQTLLNFHRLSVMLDWKTSLLQQLFCVPSCSFFSSLLCACSDAVVDSHWVPCSGAESLRSGCGEGLVDRLCFTTWFSSPLSAISQTKKDSPETGGLFVGDCWAAQSQTKGCKAQPRSESDWCCAGEPQLCGVALADNSEHRRLGLSKGKLERWSWKQVPREWKPVCSELDPGETVY